MRGARGPFRPPSSFVTAPRSALPCLVSNRLIRFRSHPHYHVSRPLQTRARDSIGAGFAYKVAAAFTGKGEAFDRKRHHYSFDSETGDGSYADKSLDRKDRRIPSGQDSFFVGSIGDTSAAAFGVVDGVGGYQESGIDSADFAHGLCRHVRDVASAFGLDGSTGRLDPQHLLQEGFKRLCHDETVKGGGSTACVAVAEPDGFLNVANLGDSGFVQLRMNAVQFYSEPQTHAFNTPFQLSMIPPKIFAQIEQFGGGSPLQDLPKDADVTSHALKHGDVLVFGTDGLWDNLTAQDVLERVSSVMMENGAWMLPEGEGMRISRSLPFLADPPTIPNEKTSQLPLQTTLALDITTKAKAASLNTKRDGPFAKAVQQHFPRERWHGGKPDDICVLVAVVIDQDAT